MWWQFNLKYQQNISTSSKIFLSVHHKLKTHSFTLHVPLLSELSFTQPNAVPTKTLITIDPTAMTARFVAASNHLTLS